MKLMDSPMPNESRWKHRLENRIPPPFVALILAGTMWLGARVTPTFDLPNGWRITLALFSGAFALGFAAPAMRAFRAARTTINPVDLEGASTLVTSGIYRLSRNPMYLGLTSLLLAWSLWLAAPATLLGPVAFILFTSRFQIIPEERVMQAKFGQAYTDYRKRVRRWL